MSFISKGDFKTRQEWLKKQRRQIMKKQSIKYQQLEKGKPTLPIKNSKPKDPAKTLNHILTVDTEVSTYNQTQQPPKLLQPFRSEGDDRLYQTMLARLKAQQQLAKQQRQHIKNLSKQIQQIKTNNAFIKGVHHAAVDLLQKRQSMLSQNQQIKLRFQQMETYLNQNGVFWEGGRIVGNFQIDKVKNNIKAAKSNYRTPNKFQFQTILKRIKQLNQALLQQFGSKKYVLVNGVHRLCENSSIDIHFYKNGLLFESIGFFTYDSRDGVRILSDFNDGYYPFPLKNTFPDGVLINISFDIQIQYAEQSKSNKQDSNDKRRFEKANGAKEEAWFLGQGHCLGD